MILKTNNDGCEITNIVLIGYSVWVFRTFFFKFLGFRFLNLRFSKLPISVTVGRNNIVKIIRKHRSHKLFFGATVFNYPRWRTSWKTRLPGNLVYFQTKTVARDSAVLSRQTRKKLLKNKHIGFVIIW